MIDDLNTMGIFYDIAHAIGASLKLEDTLQAILDALHDTLGIRAVAIRLLEPDADTLKIAASAGIGQAMLSRMPLRLVDDPIHQQVLADNARYISVVAVADEHGGKADAFLAWLTAGENITGMVAVPLQVRHRNFGALDLYCAAEFGFNEQTLTLIHAIADTAATAIEHAQLHATLFSIARAVTSTLELNQLLDQVLLATVMQMNLKATSVRLLDKASKRLELVAAHGLSQRYLAKGPIVVAQSVLDQRVLAGETVVLLDVAGEPGFQYPAEAKAEGIRSVLAVPLQAKARIIGVMRVYSAQPRGFTPVSKEFLQSVAGVVGLAIENARLYQALQTRYEDLKLDVSEWYRFLSLG